MPIISIKLAKGRSLEKKQELVEVITSDIVRILEVKPEWVTVLIEEFERENWASAGELHAVKYGPGFGADGTQK